MSSCPWSRFAPCFLFFTSRGRPTRCSRDWSSDVCSSDLGILRRPMLGKRVLIGGVDLTVECVGSSRSIDDSLRLTRSGGTVLILGLASVPRGVDWGPVWLNELNVTGSYIYGVEHWNGRRLRTVEIVLNWMAEGRVDLSPLLTHLYPLGAYPPAFTAAMGKAQTSAFKVAFQFP